MHVQAKEVKDCWQPPEGIKSPLEGREEEGRGAPANILTSRLQKPEREITITIITN